MAKDKIKLLGAWSAWSSQVRHGEMVRSDGGVIPVLLRSGAEDETPEVTSALKKDGRLLSQITGDQVLCLFHITRASNRSLWVFEGFEGVSLSRAIDVLTARSEQLPVGVALGLVRDVGHALVQGFQAVPKAAESEGDAPCVGHVGCAPGEVLVDAGGQVKLAGFCVRRAAGVDGGFNQGYSPPQSSTVAADAVYGMGVLLVHLLSGESPDDGGTSVSRHESVVRRALIRLLARSGETVPEEVVQFVRDTLKYDASERLGLDSAITRLTALMAETPGVELVEWAALEVTGLIRLQETGYPTEADTRSRRYVDQELLSSDEPSFEAPPVRSVAERQREGRLASDEFLHVHPAADLPIEGTPTGRLPTSETEVQPTAGFSGSAVSLPLPNESVTGPQIGRVAIGSAAGPVGQVALDIGGDSSWPDQTERNPRSVGWLFVIGGLAGMMLAAGLGWLVVDHFFTSPVVELVAPQPLVELPPPPEPEPEAAPEPEPAPEPEREPEVQRDVQAAPAPQRPARTPESPPPLPPAAPPAAAPGPAPEFFAVTFRSADPGVTRLIVRCHRGRGDGVDSVHIPDAGRGPCRVTGERPDGDLVVSAVLTGARTFTCFANGRRACE